MARILVIDDEDGVRRMLRMALELHGHEVLEAADGMQALRLVQQAPVELVITDILMPEKDGLEVIMALRSETPQLKVIAMSGGGRFNQVEALEIAEPLGAIAALRKPFRIDEMLETVEEGAGRLTFSASGASA